MRKRETLTAFQPERVDFIQQNLGRARMTPIAVAYEMKEKGYYSNTTYIGDIERTVKKIAAMLSNEVQAM